MGRKRTKLKWTRDPKMAAIRKALREKIRAEFKDCDTPEASMEAAKRFLGYHQTPKPVRPEEKDDTTLWRRGFKKSI